MNDKLIRRSIVKTAVKRLNEHKFLGTRSGMSVFEVAELYDIVAGKDRALPLTATPSFISLN